MRSRHHMMAVLVGFAAGACADPSPSTLNQKCFYDDDCDEGQYCELIPNRNDGLCRVGEGDDVSDGESAEDSGSTGGSGDPTGNPSTTGMDTSTDDTVGTSVSETNPTSATDSDSDSDSDTDTDTDTDTGEPDPCPGPFAVSYAVSEIAAGTNVQGIAAADLDGDGRLDLAVSAYDEDTVYVLLAVGPGQFGPPTPITVPGRPSRVRLGAIADDNVDLVVQYYHIGTFEQRTWRARGVGDGTFYFEATLGPMQHAELGDLDGNGRLDLLGIEGGQVQRRMATAAEAYGAPIAVTSGAAPLALGDLDGDGDLDLVYVSGGLKVRPGVGNGTFGADAATLTPSGPPITVTIGDVDGDGNMDVVSGIEGGGLTLMDVFYGNGTLGFRASQQITTPQYNTFVRIADVDADGHQDIVSAQGNGIALVRSLGGGSFANPVSFPCVANCINVREVIIADLNDDCVLDVVARNQSGPILYLSE